MSPKKKSLKKQPRKEKQPKRKSVKKVSKLSESLRRAAKPKIWTVDPSILLCSNIPKPMHGVAPRNIMGGVWWDATRKKAYSSTAYHCEACGIHKASAKGRQWLEGHELYDIDYERGRMTFVRVTPLCFFCHNYIHDGRMNALIQQGKFNQKTFASIIQHGDEVLKNAGLKRVTYAKREEAIIKRLLSGKVAAWKDWRLVFKGKEYPPKFKTEVQWRKAMQ